MRPTCFPFTLPVHQSKSQEAGLRRAKVHSIEPKEELFGQLLRALSRCQNTDQGVLEFHGWVLVTE